MHVLVQSQESLLDLGLEERSQALHFEMSSAFALVVLKHGRAHCGHVGGKVMEQRRMLWDVGYPVGQSGLLHMGVAQN